MSLLRMLTRDSYLGGQQVLNLDLLLELLLRGFYRRLVGRVILKSFPEARWAVNSIRATLQRLL